MTRLPRSYLLQRCAHAGAALLVAFSVLTDSADADWLSRRIPAVVSDQALPVTSSISLHPRAELIATAGDDHWVRIWNLEGQLLQQWAAHTDWVRSVTYSPDGKLLATSGNDGRIVLWDGSAGRHLRTLAQHGQPVVMIRFSNDSRLLAATGFNDKLRVYNVTTGEIRHELDCPCRDMRAMAISPDDGYLAAGGRNGRIRIWNLREGNTLQQIQAHEQRIRSLEYSPDGVYLVSTGEDRRVRVWNMLDGQVLDLPPQSAKILSMAFCGADKVALGMSDNSIRLWDLPGRKELAVLDAHQGSVCALVYHNGLLASGSYDTTVRVWDLRDAVARRAEADAQPR